MKVQIHPSVFCENITSENKEMQDMQSEIYSFRIKTL